MKAVFSKLLFLAAMLAGMCTQSGCSALFAPSARAAQDHILTNRMCHDPFSIKLISEGGQWRIEVRGIKYGLSQASDVLRPIMDTRKSKTVLALVSKDVKYKVLQEFAAYAQRAGVTCINWDPRL